MRAACTAHSLLYDAAVAQYIPVSQYLFRRNVYGVKLAVAQTHGKTHGVVGIGLGQAALLRTGYISRVDDHAVYAQLAEFVAAAVAAETGFVDGMIDATGKVLRQISVKF